MAIARARMTLDEFLRLPEEKPALEYEDGRITQKVSPKTKHSVLQAELIELFNRTGRPRRRWRALPELRTTYQGRSYVPDVAVFRSERIPLTPEGDFVQDITVPPDVATEIVSPDQSVTTLVRKCAWYVANGSPAALLVDPEDQSVLVFRPDSVPQVVQGRELVDLDDVLPGFRVAAKRIFAALRPS